MREVAFVVNPSAAAQADRLKKGCERAATSQRWLPHFFSYRPGSPNPELVQQLRGFCAGAAPEERLVFAVGGDGTVRCCAEALASGPVPLAVVARGTANLLARALGLPTSLEQALAVGFGPNERTIDLAKADGQVFTTMAGIGIDAAVVGGTPRLFKDHLGWASYALGALPRLAQAPHAMVVHIDGREPLTTTAQSVVIGNVGILPGGFGIFPGGSMQDGLLDVGVLFPKSVLGWALMARSVVAKGHFPDRCFAHYQGVHIEVLADQELPRQVDGDLMPPGRALEVTVLPAALVTRVPGP